MSPEEIRDLLRAEDLKALGLSVGELWGLDPSLLEALADIQAEYGLELVTDLVYEQVGAITEAVKAEVSKAIGAGAGAVVGSVVPGLGTILGAAIAAVLGSFLGGLFGPDRIPSDALEKKGLAYHRCAVYIPPGAYKKNKHGRRPPGNRGGVHLSQTEGEGRFPFNALENVICSKSWPYLPVARFVRFDDNDKPILSTCLGFTAEGYALFDEWPGSEKFIGVQVGRGADLYGLARSGGVPEWGIERAQRHALVAHGAGAAGGVYGPPGMAGVLHRMKRRTMATFAMIEEKGAPVRSFLFRWRFWRWVPGFATLRPGRGGEGLQGEPVYSFSWFEFKNDLRGLFTSPATREEPGGVRWGMVGALVAVLVGIAALALRKRR